MPTLLVRYGEVGLKSPSVRRRFEQQLIRDIRTRHALAGTPCVITQSRGRLFLDSDDWRKSCEILSRTFGVVSFSPVTQAPSDLPALTQAVLDFTEPVMFKDATFAVRPRRSGNHPYTSQDLAEKLGEAIRVRFSPLNAKVALDNPDLEISVEVRDNTAYMFTSILPGPGGMPLSTQGKVLSVVSSERGLASTWLMMKRGCSVLAMARDQSMLKPLDAWYPNLRSMPPAEDLIDAAVKNECIGIALELSMSDVSERSFVKGDLPVFYPLVGMSEEETKGLVRRIVA
jgi:thiamine biosynthesis protein ThiI